MKRFPSAPAAAAAVLVAACSATAQEAVFRSETALMEIEVRVTGRDGQPVRDLTAADFRLLENGRPQQIRAFERVDAAARGAQLGRFVETRAAARDAGAGLASETPLDLLRQSLFLYIAARGRPEDVGNIAVAIADFLDKQLRPGVYVSLEGRPFTADRAQLDRDLAEMTGGAWSGEGGATDRLAMGRESEADPAVQALTSLNAALSVSTTGASPVESLYGAFTLYRYIRLAQSLGAFPGKKAVVLFAPGMKVDDDNLDLVDRFEAEAARARVSFYTVDTRRLAVAPDYDAEGRGAPGRQAVSAFQDTQDGLRTLARRSGGRAIENSNRFGDVFESVLADSSEYYLLGYYPADVSRQGRFRRIRVEVDRPRVRLAYRKGYYEDREFSRMSDAEKRLDLLRALELDTAFADVPLTAGFEFFRDDDGRAAVGYALGLHPPALDAAPPGASFEAEFAVVVQATRLGEEGGAAVEERRLRMTLPPAEAERLRGNSRAAVQFASRMRLPAGEYQWRAVVRDESSGAYGSYKARLVVPDFASGHPASSLLVTARLDDAPAPRKAKGRTPAPGPFGIAEYRLWPDSQRVFRRGDPLFALYDVYDPAAAGAERPPAAKLALYRDRRRVESIPVSAYRSAPAPDGGGIRYLAALDTGKLEPGDYILGALVPAEGKPDGALVWRRFTVLPPAGGAKRR